MATGLLRVLHHPCQSLSSRMGGSNLLSLAHTNRPEVMHSHSTLSCPDRPQRSLTSVHTYMRYVQYIQWLLGGLQEHSETLTCAVIDSAATAMHCTCRLHCLRSWFWVTVLQYHCVSASTTTSHRTASEHNTDIAAFEVSDIAVGRDPNCYGTVVIAVGGFAVSQPSPVTATKERRLLLGTEGYSHRATIWRPP